VLMPPYTLPSEVDVRVNLPVLLFTLGACVLSGILFGLAPAWQAAKSNVNDALKEAGRAVGGGRSRLRQWLVAAEFALALTLLSGGGLAIQSLFTLSHLDLGFRTERLLTFSLPVPAVVGTPLVVGGLAPFMLCLVLGVLLGRGAPPEEHLGR